MRASASHRSRFVALAGALWVLTAVAPCAAEAQAMAEAAVSAAPTLAADPVPRPTASRQAFDPVQATEAYLATLDEETRARSKEYTEGGYWLEIISLFYGLAVAFFLLNTGLSARIRTTAERISGKKPLQTALYGVQYILVTTVLLLPLSVYSGFLREHRYGFSTQSMGGYISDRLIGLGISLVLVSILLALLYGAIRRAPQVGVQTSPSSVVTASSTSFPSSSPRANSARWRFENANKWARRIDPNAQAWAQQEANRLAQRGYSGYLQNGHPGGNNPYGSVTGTGTTFPGAKLIHTCEGSSGMTLVAEAAAVSRDGRIYGVRSWR